MKLTKRTYRAIYLVRSAEDMVKLLTSVEQGVVASMGDGDDQWQGMDLHDEGSSITITRTKHGFEVTFLVPVWVGPEYWFSPTQDVETFNPKGDALAGDPYRWGLLPKKRKAA